MSTKGTIQIGQLLACLDIFDSLLQIELRLLWLPDSAEQDAVARELQRFHLAVIALRFALTGYRVTPIPQGYLFAPPVN